MTRREQLPNLMQAFEHIREPRATGTQRTQVGAHEYAGRVGAEREARDAVFRNMLDVMENGGVLEDDWLATTWAGHIQQFKYDPLEAVNDWWLTWGRHTIE
jgi:salicylate hydroxylase